jgi:hypothetical protein
MWMKDWLSGGNVCGAEDVLWWEMFRKILCGRWCGICIGDPSRDNCSNLVKDERTGQEMDGVCLHGVTRMDCDCRCDVRLSGS